MRDFHFPGRSPSLGYEAAAATSHQQATLAAMETLRHGGNAVDAAVTAAALLGVIEPHSTGIGGDSFAILWSAEQQRLIGLNGSGHAPEGLSSEWLLAQGIQQISADSVHSVTVPGSVRMWERLLADHGTQSLGETLAPAIEAAEQGFPVAARIAEDWGVFASRLRTHAASRRILLVDDGPPTAGMRIRQPELAKSLRRIGAEGSSAFYDSDLTDAMIRSLTAIGGRHTRADFAEWQPEYVTPVTVNYRGVDVHQIPPNGQGITASIMLNILSGFDHSRFDPLGAERFHLQIEAYRLAAAARDTYIADPAHADVPVEALLSLAYADSLRARISSRTAQAEPVSAPIGPTDTVYLTTADRLGNMCSFISSISAAFGSAITCGETGVLFQNRGSGFRVAPGHPNTVAPRKRSLHTIIPGFATRAGQPWMSFGVMHGHYQPIGQVQVLQNIIDFGMDVQEAIDAPRGMRSTAAFEAERSIPTATLAGLARRGHPVSIANLAWGGGQAILRENALYSAGSDSRKDGCALAI